MPREGPCLNAAIRWGQRSRKVSRRISTTLGFVSVGCNVLCGKSFHPGFFFTLLIAFLLCSPVIPHMMRTYFWVHDPFVRAGKCCSPALAHIHLPC